MNDKPNSTLGLIDQICLAFERNWIDGQSPQIEDGLSAVESRLRSELLIRLLKLEVQFRGQRGEMPTRVDYVSRFPGQSEALGAVFGEIQGTEDFSHGVTSTAHFSSNLPVPPEPETMPDRIGRYRIDEVLGEGGFGRVYRGYDEDLKRAVAIKVARKDRVSRPEDVEAYLNEAQTVARLKHPRIVPVHDVGRTADGLCFVVSGFLTGGDLAARIKQQRPAFREAAEWIGQLAEALHVAHRQGVVHRDIKPANILLEEDGQLYLADFGLALREEDYGRGASLAGTPAYMSPEQARGEGHLVDGRSDIFSLGVVFYELLTGRRPFQGNVHEILEQIKHVEVRPPRQIEDMIPRELERICLKALALRASDRYPTAGDLADDLQHFLTGNDRSSSIQADPERTAPQGAVAPTEPVKIVPKGLRSFDADDADFFLELLPGPRDREGLPESLRFWKQRIETTNQDKSFRVGLIYGPSGCGKSSLVKAGLLPRLADHVLAIYIEATPDDTETRLQYALANRLNAKGSLGDVLADLRRGRGLRAGQKVLIVLDQFEQWLHVYREKSGTDLVEALRQCDGVHLQCVVMVRDDFWMAVTRFIRELEIDLEPHKNIAAVDLFESRHATNVLADFGRAFGCLPEKSDEMSHDQAAFLDQAVSGLARDGKIICVRLALFAEMMKGKSWTPATLKAVGGTEGTGATFLEETFASPTANPQYRLHQKAARNVLRALLPESGTDIKGHMRSHTELLEASGYAQRPKEFTDLLRILDQEVRLITPTDPEGQDDGEPTETSGQFYQLTHDYLVPSLRDWLTKKQKETRRGRAELRLAERSALWNAKPLNRNLPAWWENLNIRQMTDKKKWTEAQRKMMRKSGRVHGVRSALVLIALIAMISIGAMVRTQVAQQQEVTRIEGLVGQLVSAEPGQLPDIIRELDANPELATAFLSPLVSSTATTPDEKRSQLHARLATVSRDPSLIDPLVEELLAGKVSYVLPIRQQLRPSAGSLKVKFQDLLRDESADSQRRFRAALALADFVPESEAGFWKAADLKFVAEQLVSSNAEFQPLLREALTPIAAKLLAPLERIFADSTASDAQRLSAANAYADYAADDIPKLSGLLVDATPEQYDVLYPLVAANSTPAIIESLGQIAATLPPEELGSVERVPFGQRRANAAVTLLRLGEREKVLPVFEMTDDPEALTQFVFRCRPRGVGVESLLDCLQRVASAPQDRYPQNTLYALLLALGEYSLEDIPDSRRDALLKQLADWYRDDPRSGVHGAAGWLLRQWGQAELARQVDQTAVPYSPDREWFTLAITVKPTPEEKESKPDPKTFYYTFIVFPAGESNIGSVDDEPDRQKNEIRHPVKLTRPFAVLDREVTMEELIAFLPIYGRFMQQYDAKPSDAGFGADWYDSVAFCVWLGEQSGLPESDQAYSDPKMLNETDYPREPNPVANWAPRDWPLNLDRRGFRLPTESEWEVASRAGARTAYGYGSEVSLLGQFGWFMENSGKHGHPPKELRPSVRGLFDLHGNLFEWTHDWFEEYSSELLTDPLGRVKGGSYRVVRGGGRIIDAAICRSAFRRTDAPTARSFDIGFRLALSPSGVLPEAVPEQGTEPSGVGTEGAQAEPQPEMP